MSSKKLPALQFYPGDWKKDPGVQALDYEHRGVWLEILLLMHESDQRGYLLLNGKPMPEEALARTLGLDKQKVSKIVSTLLDYGVAKQDDGGAVYCKRMVKEEEIRQKKVEAGRKGGKKSKPPDFEANPKQTRSKPEAEEEAKRGSSTSTSTSSSDKNKPPGFSETEEESESDPLDIKISKSDELPDSLKPKGSVVSLTIKIWERLSKDFGHHKNHKKANLLDWSEHIRLMNEQDELTLPKIWELFDWANKDERFWKATILSTNGLRNNWQEIDAQMKRKPKKQTNGESRLDRELRIFEETLN